MEDSKKKNYQIIAILSKTKAIINIGKKDGVNKDSKFDILTSRKEELIDPSTGEALATFPKKKQRLYVLEVNEKYTICISKVTKDEYRDTSLSRTEVLNPFVKRVSRTYGREMNVNPEDIHDVTSPFSYEPIKIGDTVEIVK